MYVCVCVCVTMDVGDGGEPSTVMQGLLYVQQLNHLYLANEVLAVQRSQSWTQEMNDTMKTLGPAISL